MNRKAKGNRVLNNCIEEFFYSPNQRVAKTEKTSRFAKEKDLFGLFDFISISTNKVVFVQVTTNKPHPHKKYLDFYKLYGGTNLIFKQYVWYDRRGWVIFTYTNTKYQLDLRKPKPKKKKVTSKRKVYK